VSAPAAGTHTATDTVAGVLAARYPGLSPGQSWLLETAILHQLTIAGGLDCALAALRSQPDGTLHISVLFIGRATGP
jgi:hypothetical protein